MSNEAASRRPSLVAGTIIGVIIAAVLAALVAVLSGVDVGSAPVILVAVLFVGWTVWCGVTYGKNDESAASH